MSESRKNPRTNYLVLVPEQFTMQTQKDIVMLSEAKGVMNVDILSFMRLAYRVLEETPALDKPILEDEGKSMVIRRILREHASEWKTFGGNIHKLGFVEEIKSIISELLLYRMDEEEIQEMQTLVSTRKILQTKLEDILLVLRYYKEYMEERYISAEEILPLVASYAMESDLLQDSVLCLDGFTGFTPDQTVLFQELLGICKDIYITVTIDPEADPFGSQDPYELFYMSKKFIRRCTEAAVEKSIEIAPIYWAKTEDGLSWRFRNNPSLAIIERDLYRYHDSTVMENEINQACHLYAGINPYEEVRFCVWKIRELIRREGYRYQEVAVVSGDSEMYGRLFGEEFARVGIPYFTDNNRAVIDNPFVTMVLGLFQIVQTGMRYDAVMGFIKNGFVRDYLQLKQEEMDRLENFVLATGKRGMEVWNSRWTIRGRHSYDLELVNLARQQVVDIIYPFYQAIKESKTVRCYCQAMYQFFIEHTISDCLYQQADWYEEQGHLLQKKEYEQIYRITIRLLEQMVELMGEEEVTTQEFYELLKTGFTEATVGVVPPGVDTVVIGDITRTRLKNIKALFFVGLNDGIVPKATSSGGFLSDMEREFMLERGAELAPTLRERIFSERFYLYLNATKPSELLYLTFSQKGCMGEEREVSSFVKEVQKIYGPRLPIESNYISWGQEQKLENDLGRSWWIRGLRDYVQDVTEEEEPKAWMELHKIWGQRQKGILSYAFYSGKEASLSARIARQLYGSDLVGSVSRFEQYASCAYAHFLQYGLCLHERKEYKIEIPDMGILFHNVIEEFTKRLKYEKLRWQEVGDEQILEWTSEIASKACIEYEEGKLFGTSRDSYLSERVSRISIASIKALAEHMRKGTYETKGFEIQFSDLGNSPALEIPVDETSTIHLTGRIDRLDVCELEDAILYKVIDYKSGNRSFDLLNTYYGISMQLVVYLAVASEMGKHTQTEKKVIPAGAFYFHIDDPTFKDISEDTIQEEKMKAFQMNGVLNTTEQALCTLDTELGSLGGGFNENVKSGVIKA